jgi:hypothetical protein
MDKAFKVGFKEGKKALSIYTGAKLSHGDSSSNSQSLSCKSKVTKLSDKSAVSRNSKFSYSSRMQSSPNLMNLKNKVSEIKMK